MKKIYLLITSIFTLLCLQVAAQTPYYYNGVGIVTSTASWGINTDGSGANPSDFISNDQIFNLVNGAGSATLTANWTVSGTNSKIVIGDGVVPFNLSTSTFTVTGTVDISNLGVFTVQSTTSPFTLGALAAGSTVDYALDGTQSVRTGTYHHLTLSNATASRLKTASGAITVNGILTVTTLNTLVMGANVLSGTIASTSGNGTITTTNTSVNPLPDAVTWTQSVQYNGTTSHALPNGTYENLTIGGSNDTKTANGNITVNSVLDVVSGNTLAMTTFALSGLASAPTGTGTITTTHTATANPIPSGITWTQTVSYLATTTQTIVNGTYQNLTVGGGGSVVKSPTANVNVIGTLTVNTSTIFDLLTFDLSCTTITNSGTIRTQSTSASPIPSGKTIGGTFLYNSTSPQTVVAGSYTTINTSGGDRTISNSDTFAIVTAWTTGSGVIDLTGTSVALRGTTVTLTITGQTAMTFNNLVVSGAGTKTFSNTNAIITINGNLTIPGTTTYVLAMGTNKLVFGGGHSLSGTGTLTTAHTSTTEPIPNGTVWPFIVNYSSAASQSVSTGTYGRLIISGNGTSTVNGDITVNDSLAVTAGTLAMGTNLLLGAIAGNGGTGIGGVAAAVISTLNTTATPLPVGRVWPMSVTYAAAANQTIVDGTYNAALTISGGASGIKTASGNLTIGTTLTVAASTILDMSTFALSALTFTSSGTIRTQNTSATPISSGKTIGGTVEYNGAGSQTVVHGTYTNLDISGGTRDLSGLGDIVVGGTLTATTGTINGGTSNVRLTGGNLNITLGASGSFNNFRVVGTGTRTVVAGSGSLSVNGELEVHSVRTLALNDNQLLGTITTNTGTGTITTTRATAAIPAGKTWTLSVSYSGTTQEVIGGTYRRLLIAGTLTKTATGTVTVNDTLNIGSPLDMSTFQLTGTLTSILGTATLTTANEDPTAPIPAGRTWLSTTVFYNSANMQTVVNGQYVALNLTGGDRTLSPTDTIKVSGAFTAGSGTYTSTGSTFALNGATTQTFNGGGNTFNNFAIILGTTKTVAVNGFNVDGQLTVNSGSTLAMATFQLGGAIASTNGTGLITTACVAGNPLPNGETWSQAVTYNAATQNVADGIYNNTLTIATTGTKTALGNITANGTLTVTATLNMGTFLLDGSLTGISGTGTIITQNVSSAPIPEGKTWSQNITYNSTSPQTVVSGVYSLALNVNGGDRTFSSLATITVGGAFTASTGAAVYTTTGTIFNFSSTVSQTITLQANFPFINVQFNGAHTATISGSFTVATALQIVSGTIVNMGTGALGGAALTTFGTGALRTQNTSATPIPSGRTWTFRMSFDANANQTIPAATFSGGLFVSGTTGSRTKTLAGDISVDDTLSITTTFATLVLGGNTLTLNGIINPAQTGTITGGLTSNIVIGSGSADAGILNMTQTNTTTRSLNNLTISRNTGGTALTLGNEVRLINVLSLTDGTLASNGNLVFVSTGVSTSAQIDEVTGTGNVSGDVVVQRFIDGQPVATNVRWRFLASPVNTSTGIDDNWQKQIYITGSGTGGTLCPSLTPHTNGIDPTPSNSPSFYTRNAATDTWEPLANTNATELVTGVGYRVFYRGSRSQSCINVFTDNPPAPIDTTLVATGTLAIGTQIITGSNIAGRYSLAGNPFQATIDWESPAIVRSNISSTISTFRPNTTNGAYAYYTVGVGGTNGMTQYMSPGTGFWIQTVSAGAASVSIGEAAKVVSQGGDGFFKTAPVEDKVLRIKLFETGQTEYLDEAIISQRTNADWAYNPGEEAQKIGFTTGLIQLQVPNAATKYAICVVPGFEGTNNRIYIDAKTVIGTNYTLNFAGVTTFDPTLGFTLYDTYTGTNQDLRTNVVYNFTTPDAASIAANRFYILFTPNAAPLPVKLISFKGERTAQNETALNWQTASEEGSDRFEIERSVDGRSFTMIGASKAAKYSSKTVRYAFIDNAPVMNEVNYYRLKQVDLNGTYTYSSIVSVSYKKAGAVLNSSDIIMYPVPASNTLTVEVKSIDKLNNPALQVYDMFGKELSLPVVYDNGKWQVETSTLKAGVYLVHVTHNGNTTQLKVLKD